jgi:hypothetical protein
MDIEQFLLGAASLLLGSAGTILALRSEGRPKSGERAKFLKSHERGARVR